MRKLLPKTCPQEGRRAIFGHKRSFCALKFLEKRQKTTPGMISISGVMIYFVEGSGTGKYLGEFSESEVIPAEVALIRQQRILCAEVIVEDQAEAVDRRDGVVKFRFADAGEVVGVEDFELGIVGFGVGDAVITLNDDDRRGVAV